MEPQKAKRTGALGVAVPPSHSLKEQFSCDYFLIDARGPSHPGFTRRILAIHSAIRNVNMDFEHDV